MQELVWQLYIIGKHKMGRFISTGTTQIGTNTCSVGVATTCYQVTSQQYAYDANSCWQNRVIVDTPGSYTFVVPAGVTCLRTIAVGGGGKVKGCSPVCCGMAGAGGAYVERTDTVVPGCIVTVVVGRQEQDTTISYVCAGGATRLLTAGGAAACTPGVGSGGEWNSSGGCAGFNQSSGVSCGKCVYVTGVLVCGYCLVYSGVSGRTIDPDHSVTCCQPGYAGGGSAGSWIWTTGGAGQRTINQNQICQGDTYSAIAGGGGGIGYIARDWQGSQNCTCVCVKSQCGIGYPFRKTCHPIASGGGGGTKFQCQSCFEFWANDGFCAAGTWRMGEGGWGGQNNDEGRSGWLHWWCSNNSACMGRSTWLQQGPSPKRYPWHDIHEMSGSGSPGQGFHAVCYQSDEGNLWNQGHRQAPLDCVNAGEGAGTGGVVFNCCAVTSMGMSCCVQGALACIGINMTLVCCLGTSGRICCADKMLDQLFPYVVHCAGTLGGSGGVGTCNLASRAGKGGGAGIPRNYLLCVCWGGNFDFCNNNPANPLLAFPPCDLDWRASMAGTGMAIIYWKNP